MFLASKAWKNQEQTIYNILELSVQCSSYIEYFELKSIKNPSYKFDGFLFAMIALFFYSSSGPRDFTL